MTEKRFVDYFDKDHNYIIQDLQNEDEYQVGFVNCDEDVFLELINQLSDENEQLKQFKDNVFDLIDKNIKETKELFEEDKIDLNSYNSAMIILTRLKEELKGDVE